MWIIIIYWLVTRTVWIIIIYWLDDALKVCIDSNRVLQTDMIERLVYERKKRYSPFMKICELYYIFTLSWKNCFLPTVFSTEW